MENERSLRERSERLGGIGTITCQDIDTGKTWDEYDALRIYDEEERISGVLRNDIIGKTLFVTGALYALVKNKIRKYFN
ncbi:hypothetical protein HYT25_04675 [Candidatus Pacearchaeota archaeon]|nr:hypothetical protein [Candidatus Pacearchaeota archaeon]